MESFFSRYRNLLVLFVLLVGQIVGLAVQVRRTTDGRSVLDPKDGSGVRLIRYWAESMVIPTVGGIHYSRLGMSGLWQSYIDLHNVRQQNLDLQRTIDRLRLEQAALLEDAKQGHRLQAMLDFQQKYIYKTIAAQAVATSGSDQSRLFYIDKGSDQGLKPDMAVITADGIVGKVRDVWARTAQVLAINDQTSGAGVILETTRIRGILRGNAAGRLEIIGVIKDDRIKPGEKVLTAGGDMIFPRGLPVGEVQEVVADPERDSHIVIYLKPAAQLNRLDEVLIITVTDPRFSDEQQQDMATSEALKAPDVNTLREQQKASKIMAERLPGLTDPNLPADQQPQQPPEGTPPPPPGPTHAQPALHPDRFSPSASPAPKPVTPAAPVQPQAKSPATALRKTKPNDGRN